MIRISKGFISRLSIKHKLIFLVLVVLLLVILIAFSLLITWGIRDYKGDLENSMHLHARLIGEYCISPLAFSDPEGASDVLRKVKSVPEVSSALLFNEKDSLVARFDPIKTTFPGVIDLQKIVSGYTGRYLFVAEPIHYQSRHFGTILLIASTDLLDRQIREYVGLLLLVMVILVILSYFLTSYLQGFISKPILKLAEFTDVISRSGDYSLRITREGDDEIGILYDRFNEMLEQIRLREQESVMAAREIRISNEKLNLILDNAPFGFIHYGPDGRISTINKGHEEIFSLHKEEILGKNLYNTIRDKEMLKAFDRSLHGEPATFTGNYTSTTSGVTTFIRAIYTPLFSDKNRIIGGVGIFEDISEQKRIERLQVEKEAAVFANKAKSIFLANMSHEIRTPLNAILGFSQLMEKDMTLSEDQRENIAIINSSGEHLLALINNILEMSKIEAGRIQLNSITFNLPGLLEEVGTLFRTKTDEKKLYLMLEIAETVPRIVDADEGKIRQIIINLLSNAVKFTTEGGIVLRAWTVATPPGKYLLYVEVEDTGAGIAEEEIGKVFQHFEQTRSGKQVQSGTGLGLAICKEYIHMMRGEISVKSRVGQGSLFRFYIEISEGDQKNVVFRERKNKVIGLEPGQKELRILVVDDKEANRKLLAKMLSKVGFTIESASDGLEAIELYKSWNPDLILMDMFMPVMDGFEAIHTIRDLPGGKEVHIIAVTASVFEEDKQNILESGADEFIKKPFREYEIFEKIAERLDVKFISREEEEVPATVERSEPLNAEDIYAIPSAVAEQIKEALIDGDIAALEEKIGLIDPFDANLASRLRALVKSFNLETLNQLFDLK